LKMRLPMIAAVLLGANLTGACAASQNGAGATAVNGPLAAQPAGTNVTDAQLPINQRFRSLDEYLAWLEKTAAPVDRPWYKEIRPGVYELQTAGNLHLDVPSNEKRVFTRAELEKKFGFSR
jgi:hypothetical protein